MNKLLKAVETQLLSKRRPDTIYDNINSMDLTTKQRSSATVSPLLYEYYIGTSFSTINFCRPCDVIKVKQNFLRRLCLFIFGDMIHSLYEIQAAIYCGNRERALDLIHQLLTEVNPRSIGE